MKYIADNMGFDIRKNHPLPRKDIRHTAPLVAPPVEAMPPMDVTKKPKKAKKVAPKKAKVVKKKGGKRKKK